MSKRELTPEEKHVCEKRKQTLTEDQAYIEYQVKYHELMIKEGLEQNFKRQLKQFVKQKNILEEDYDTNTRLLDTLTDQLDNGVEIKEPVQEESEEETKND